MIIEHSGGAFYTSAGKHCGVIITTGLAQFLKPLHTKLTLQQSWLADLYLMSVTCGMVRELISSDGD